VAKFCGLEEIEGQNLIGKMEEKQRAFFGVNKQIGLKVGGGSQAAWMPIGQSTSTNFQLGGGNGGSGISSQSQRQPAFKMSSLSILIGIFAWMWFGAMWAAFWYVFWFLIGCHRLAWK
jgi:hypothetical protein